MGKNGHLNQYEISALRPHLNKVSYYCELIFKKKVILRRSKMFQCLFLKRLKCPFFPLALTILPASCKHSWSRKGKY